MSVTNAEFFEFELVDNYEAGRMINDEVVVLSDTPVDRQGFELVSQAKSSHGSHSSHSSSHGSHSSHSSGGGGR